MSVGMGEERGGLNHEVGEDAGALEQDFRA